MPRSFKKLTIDNVADGAVKDLFEHEWNRIMRDIADSNKQAKAPRTVTIKVKVKPTEDRGSGDVEIEAFSTLAKPKASKGTVYLSTEGEEVVSYVNDPHQTELDMEPQEVGSGR